MRAVHARERHGPVRGAIQLIAFAGAYAALAGVSWLLVDAAGRPLYWLPEGLATGVLLRTDRRRWPLFLASIPLALLAAGLLGLLGARDAPLAVRATWVLENVTVPLATAWALERLVGHPVRLRRPFEVVGLVAVAAAIVPAATVFFGAPLHLLWPAGRAGASLLEVAARYASLYSIPILAIVPLFATWPSEPWLRRISARQLAELLAIVAALAAFAWAGFFAPSHALQIVALAIAAFPVLAWTAARFGPTLVAQLALALFGVGTALSFAGLGPFGDPALAGERLIFLQGSYAAAIVSALTVAAEAATSREHAGKLEETVALLDTIMESAPVGICVIDRALRFVQVNDGLARLGGRPARELVGRRMAEAVPHAARAIEPLVWRVIDTGRPLVDVDVEGRLDPSRDGDAHWLCSFYPIRSGAGALLGVGAIVVDISDRKRQERELARLYRAAQEAIRVRDDFLSIASHELKTPLTPLSARLQVLRRRIAEGLPLDVALADKALASLEKLTMLINDLLDASRVEQGRLTLHRERIDLLPVVRDATAAAAEGATRHAVRVEGPAEPVWVRADPIRLAQVVDNLVSNAIKYSPEGGSVRVAVEPRGEEVRLSVADEGIGIPPDQLDALFDRFFRARNVSSRSYGGIGLGLYIAQDIVARHGGRIWAESRPGRGSTFHVALPRLRDSERPAEGVPAP